MVRERLVPYWWARWTVESIETGPAHHLVSISTGTHTNAGVRTNFGEATVRSQNAPKLGQVRQEVADVENDAALWGRKPGPPEVQNDPMLSTLMKKAPLHTLRILLEDICHPDRQQVPGISGRALHRRRAKRWSIHDGQSLILKDRRDCPAGGCKSASDAGTLAFLEASRPWDARLSSRSKAAPPVSERGIAVAAHRKTFSKEIA